MKGDGEDALGRAATCHGCEGSGAIPDIGMTCAACDGAGEVEWREPRDRAGRLLHVSDTVTSRGTEPVIVREVFYDGFVRVDLPAVFVEADGLTRLEDERETVTGVGFVREDTIYPASSEDGYVSLHGGQSVYTRDGDERIVLHHGTDDDGLHRVDFETGGATYTFRNDERVEAVMEAVQTVRRRDRERSRGTGQ